MITSEMRRRIFERDEWACVVCGAPLSAGQPQLAHNIPKTVANIAKYGIAVIDNPLNLSSVESLKCNSACIVHGERERQLVADIKNALARGEGVGYGD